MTLTMDREQQRIDALARANEVRCASARLVKRVRAMPYQDARAQVADLLADPDVVAGSLPVRRLLLAIGRLGQSKTHRILSAAGVSSGDRRVRDLSDRQRYAIAGLLRGVGSSS